MPFSSSAESSRAAPGRGRPMQPTRHCHCALSCPFSSSDMSSPASRHHALGTPLQNVQKAESSGRGVAQFPMQHNYSGEACSCCCVLHLGAYKASKQSMLHCHTEHHKLCSAEAHDAKLPLTVQTLPDSTINSIKHKPHSHVCNCNPAWTPASPLRHNTL